MSGGDMHRHGKEAKEKREWWGYYPVSVIRGSAGNEQYRLWFMF